MYFDLNISLSNENTLINSINNSNSKDDSNNNISSKTIETIAYSLIDGFRVFALNHKINNISNLDKRINLVNLNPNKISVVNTVNPRLNINTNNTSNTNLKSESSKLSKSLNKENSSLVNSVDSAKELNEKILTICSKLLLSSMTPTNYNHTSTVDTTNKNSNNLSSITQEDYRILTRVTVEIKDKKELLQLSCIDNSNVDILSVIVLNDSLIETVYNESEIEIIQISCYEKKNFYAKKKNILTAINRGVFFEFNYSELLQSDTRSLFIYNFTIFLDITKGKNVIISSGASEFIFQRSPYDVLVTISTIFEIDKELVKSFISTNPEIAVRNGIQRKFYKNVVVLEKDSKDSKDSKDNNI